MEAKLPVCRFGLLEPSDDPRYVCFLWSLHQSSGHQQSLPFGAMYLLNYDSKQNITNYGNLYQASFIGFCKFCMTLQSGNF